MWLHHRRPTPDYIKIVTLLMACDLFSVFLFHFRLGVLHISLLIRKIQPRGWKKKNKQTNTDLGQPQAQEREFVTLFILRVFVDYRGHVFCAKLLQKPLEMLTHLWQSSITASFCWRVLPLDCYLKTIVLLCSLLSTTLSGTFLPSSTSSLAGDLAVRPFE